MRLGCKSLLVNVEAASGWFGLENAAAARAANGRTGPAHVYLTQASRWAASGCRRCCTLIVTFSEIWAAPKQVSCYVQHWLQPMLIMNTALREQIMQ